MGPTCGKIYVWVWSRKPTFLLKIKDDMNTEIISRLIQGKSLDSLGLGMKDGRLDLSGLIAPEPAARKAVSTEIADVSEMEVLVIKGVTWKGLDFSGSRLNGLRFFDCEISDCVFDKCSCQDWRLWTTTVSETSIRSADLRKSALGGVQDGRRNTFRKVEFINADLRQTSYVAAEFVGCTFKDTRLDKADFQTSTFTECTFEGELREVLFHRRGFKGEAFPANEMTNVDFSRAKLRWVEFRGLDLETVRFPEDDDHLIVDDYPRVLDRLLERASGRDDVASKRLTAVLLNKRKWVGAGQHRGVFNKSDLLEIVGEEGLRSVLEIIVQTHAAG
jgi:uncharacterized protein YjbI with pentapeptide repeats